MRNRFLGFAGCCLTLVSITVSAQNTFPATGNVGIGTTSPQSVLTLTGGYLDITAGSGQQGYNEGIRIHPAADGCSAFVLNAIAGTSGTGAGEWSMYSCSGQESGALNFYNSGNEVITALSNGNVGIGTVTPGASLHVIAPALAATSGSTLPLLTLQNPNGNQNQLNVTQIRSSNVNNWTSATTRIQQVTDVSQQAYIDFNPVGGTWDMAFGADRGEIMRLLNTGNVGIGTTAPGAKLEVDGSVKLTAGSGASVTYQDGSVQTVAWNGVLGGGDYAESVDVSGDRAQYEPGDVLVIDPSAEGKFLRSTQPYSTAVMGIYSTNPGVVGRRQTTDKSHMKAEVPMAMVGVVPTKVNTEGGAIKPGDLLVTSSTPGYAMKGRDRSQLTGAIIGKALGHLDAGKGVIEVAVSIQ